MAVGAIVTLIAFLAGSGAVGLVGVGVAVLFVRRWMRRRSAPVLPDWGAASVATPWPLREVSEALEAFSRTWEASGQPGGGMVRLRFAQLILDWIPGRNGDRHFPLNGSDRVTGVFIRPRAVTCGYLPGDRISDTALAHELVHVALYAVHGDEDPDHEADRYADLWTPEHTAIVRRAEKAMAEVAPSVAVVPSAE